MTKKKKKFKGNYIFFLDDGEIISINEKIEDDKFDS